MHDAERRPVGGVSVMSRVKALCGGGDHRHRESRRHPQIELAQRRDEFGYRTAVNALHDDVVTPAFCAEVLGVDHVGVADLRRQPGFVQEHL